MMCKRCSASLAEEDKFCKMCGKKVQEGGKLKKVAGVLVLLVGIAACSAYIVLDQRGFFATFGSDELDGENTAPPDDTFLNALPTATPLPTPAATADFSKDITEVNTILSGAYTGVEGYVLERSDKSFVSKGGFLFDLTENRAVNIADLTASYKPEDEHTDENVYFFYLRPCDFAEFDEVEFDDSQELVIFSGYETKTGVALHSKKYDGIVYREHLNKVLAMYGGNDGEMTRTLSFDKKYNDIVDAVLEYEPNYGQLDVRYMTNDNKYAVAVVSPKIDSTDLLGYVLEKTDTGYRVVKGNFEKYEKPVVEVNLVIPHMNIELMPKFDMIKTGLLPASTYTGILAEQKNRGEVRDADLPVEFISGTGDYVYIVYKSGVKFFGVNKGNADWKMTRVDSRQSAELLMIGNTVSGEPPIYIFRQE